MRNLLSLAVVMTLGASPALAEPHVRYIVHGASNALTSASAREEVPRSPRALNLRIDAPPTHKIHLHPRMQPPPVRSSRFDNVPPPPALRVEFLTQSHTDDEPSAFNSVSTSLYKQLPSTDTESGIHIITTPQLIKSADGRVLGAGLTANF
ncbi:MAG TPA: hypothetical protein VGM39_14195 [Kofleriaceae bacterium]